MSDILKQINIVLSETHLTKNTSTRRTIKLKSEGHKCFLAENSEGHDFLKLAYEESFFYNLILGLINNSLMKERHNIDSNDIKSNLKYRLAYLTKHNNFLEILDAKHIDVENLDRIRYIDVTHYFNKTNDNLEITLIPVG
jgi:hypothetical protein